MSRKYTVDLWGKLEGDDLPRLLVRTVTTPLYLAVCVQNLMTLNGASYIKIRNEDDEKVSFADDWYRRATAHGV
jgi:hypothetical protein